jgi:hypothetical protein
MVIEASVFRCAVSTLAKAFLCSGVCPTKRPTRKRNAPFREWISRAFIPPCIPDFRASGTASLGPALIQLSRNPRGTFISRAANSVPASPRLGSVSKNGVKTGIKRTQ